MNRCLSLIAFLCLASTLPAQDWAREKVDKSPRHREWVTVTHDGRKVETFVAYPERKDKAPVIVVIHEIFGMSAWVEDVADQFAEAGFIAIAPDLLSGTGPNGGGTASYAAGDVGKGIQKLDAAQITADLNAVADYGLKLASAQKKLYVTGFCWGGGQTFRFATARKDLAAAFPFYGPPPAKESIANTATPVYGFFAGNDNRINAMLPDAIEGYKAAGKTFEPATYDGAGHGFMRAGEAPDASEANKKARADAWARLKKLTK